MPELPLLLLLTAVSAIAAVAQSATGTGYGIVAAPLLVLIDPGAVPGPLLVSTVVVMAVVMLRHRAALSLRDLLPALLGAVPGVAAGFVLVGAIPTAAGMLAVGVIVVVAVGAAVTGTRIPSSTPSLAVAGAVAGAFTVIAATPGPPLALVYRRDDPNRLRANLSAFFLISSIGTVIPLLMGASGGWPPISHTVALCLGVVVGVLAASPLLALTSARSIRVTTLALCALAGLTLIVRALFELTA